MTDHSDLEARLDALETQHEERIAELETQVADLEEQVSTLEGEVDEREQEVEELAAARDREQRKRRGLEHTIAHVERALADCLDFLQTDVWDLEDIVYGDLDGATADAHVRNDGDVFTRINKLETCVEEVAHGEVDAAKLAAQQASPAIDDLTPLHQLYTTATNLEPHQHDLTANQEIAARLFPHLAQYATPHGDELHLTSNKLRDVIEREIATPELAKRLDVRHPNRNTIRRVMEFIGRFGKDLLEFAPASSDDRRNDRNLVIIDRDSWRDYTQQFTDCGDGSMVTAGGGGGGESQQVLTDGGDVTLS
ncbi:hypothetical protein [Halorubellus salinus]|uniref:hypothetical protein n=1 Tax=Halorubellus salinus TaxID=755309 RepID=UPI001D070528|nr:hypothetical protein [Halorubellus salinus]